MVGTDTVSLVRDFIRSNFYLSEKFQTIDPDISLMETGILDSTGILEVIDFLEDRFGITILNGDISPDNLDSLNKIAKFVDRKKI